MLIRALDRSTSQGYAPVPETIVSQPSRLRVPGQVTDLPPHRGVVGLARRQALHSVDHYPALARFEEYVEKADERLSI